MIEDLADIDIFIESITSSRFMCEGECNVDAVKICYFVTDKTLSAKRISLGNYFFHVTTMTYF